MKPAVCLLAENVSFTFGADVASAGYSIVMKIGRDRSGQFFELAIVEAAGLQLLMAAGAADFARTAPEILVRQAAPSCDLGADPLGQIQRVAGRPCFQGRSADASGTSGKPGATYPLYLAVLHSISPLITAQNSRLADHTKGTALITMNDRLGGR
jgi:hypothetical protein